MGGKKKTKWRKLPLEEFTKEIPSKSEELPLTDTCQTDARRDENDFIPSYSGPPEITQNYAEPYEHIDNVWYPTSCVIYNPALCSSYMMPTDTYYYYCTVPEAGQMQEYMTVPYQEYSPALPKDTVYLLLPTQTFRPTQPVQNIVPEFQNRRRRRRYEGYADYAVIPEKTSSSKIEEKDNKVPGTNVNSRKKNTQYNNFRRMSSFSDTSSSDGLAFEQNQILRESNQTKKNLATIDNEKGPNHVHKEIGGMYNENGHQPKKNSEICGVHSINKTTTKMQQSGNEKASVVSSNGKVHLAADMFNTSMENKKTSSGELSGDISMAIYSNPLDNPLDSRFVSENMKKQDNPNEQFDDINNIDSITNNSSKQDKSLNKANKEITNSLKLKHNHLEDITVENETNIAGNLKSDSQSSLPDILSSLNKTTNGKLSESDHSLGNHLYNNVCLKQEETPKPQCPSPKIINTQTLFSSDALHNEMEMELEQLQNLKASQANQSIYKLAYDENITDQSENSRSPSPVTPESQIPCSYAYNEIIVHEADSDESAGSEDVELIPHRYESESYLNKLQNKNVYENKLSLAVELLRTQENLPYDDEFKRIVGDQNVEPRAQSYAKLNFGFSRDSCSPEKSNTSDTQNKREYNTRSGNEITSQRQVNPSPDNSSDSAIFSDIDTNNVEKEKCEPTKEAVSQRNENQDNSEEIQAGFRRLGIQARRQFTPLPFNPCFCCAIM